jgi:hypothetical protein
LTGIPQLNGTDLPPKSRCLNREKVSARFHPCEDEIAFRITGGRKLAALLDGLKPNFCPSNGGSKDIGYLSYDVRANRYLRHDQKNAPRLHGGSISRKI